MPGKQRVKGNVEYRTSECAEDMPRKPLYTAETVVKQWSQGGLIDALLSIPLPYILKYGFRTNGGIANIYVQGGNWEVFR